MKEQDRYIKMYDWMVTDLGLSGNELVLYALIASFPDGYYASYATTATRIGISRRKTYPIFKKLVEKGLLSETEEVGMRTKKYTAIGTKGPRVSKESSPSSDTQELKGYNKSSAKIAPLVVQKLHHSKESDRDQKSPSIGTKGPQNRDQRSPKIKYKENNKSVWNNESNDINKKESTRNDANAEIPTYVIMPTFNEDAIRRQYSNAENMCVQKIMSDFGIEKEEWNTVIADVYSQWQKLNKTHNSVMDLEDHIRKTLNTWDKKGELAKHKGMPRTPDETQYGFKQI